MREIAGFADQSCYPLTLAYRGYVYAPHRETSTNITCLGSSFLGSCLVLFPLSGELLGVAC